MTQIKKKQNAWSLFRRYPNNAHDIAYRKAKAEFRRLRRKSQHESWVKYVSNINYTTPSKKTLEKSEKIYGSVL